MYKILIKSFFFRRLNLQPNRAKYSDLRIRRIVPGLTSRKMYLTSLTIPDLTDSVKSRGECEMQCEWTHLS